MMNEYLTILLDYAISAGLLSVDDRTWAANMLLDAMHLTSYEPTAYKSEKTLAEILDVLCDDAVARNVIEDGVVSRDLFDTRLMGIVTPRPSEVIAKFRDLYAQSPKKATDWYYDFSRATNYIRVDRVQKDLKWTYDSAYGTLDITVNLSKPEKDPKAIAAAKLLPQSGYPKCNLCRESEGHSGSFQAPARQNHRIIPIQINAEEWFLQYSPYVYYNEHCIVLNGTHTPMKIDRSAFNKLLDFIELFPHYFVGSNADLPIVGGSILSHEHFQGGGYTFAMEKAPVETVLHFAGFENVQAGIVRWPMSVIRLNSADRVSLVELADRILCTWRKYSDEKAFIFYETDSVPHNTITPIARMRDGKYELDLVLRNNITTDEHPMGVYHPHEELHHIKKENIGLIEVMGLAVLPARLKTEMKKVADMIVSGGDLTQDEDTAKHAVWAEEVTAKHPELNKDNVDAVLKQEIGLVFEKVLACAGVYARTAEGKEAFLRFVNAVNDK